MIGQTSQDKVTTDIKKLEQKNLDDVADQLAKILNTLVESTIGSFTRKAESLVMDGSGWGIKVNIHKANLTGFLSNMVDNCKEKMRAKLSLTAQKAHQANIKEFIHEKINEMPELLAADLKDAYTQQIESFNENL